MNLIKQKQIAELERDVFNSYFGSDVFIRNTVFSIGNVTSGKACFDSNTATDISTLRIHTNDSLIGNGYSILDVINTAEQVTGKKLKYKTDNKREGDPPILIASSEKAKRILNWKPKYYHLSKIIKDAWNWEKIKIKYNESLN